MRTLEAYVSGLRTQLSAGQDIVRNEPRAQRVAVEDVELGVRTSMGFVRGDPPSRSRCGCAREEVLALLRGELLVDEPHAEQAFPLRTR